MRSYKRILFLFVCLILIQLSNPFQQDSVNANTEFTDLENVPWAQSSIHFLSERETIAGYNDGRFGPNDSITRAQAVAILVRDLYLAEIGTDINNDISFTDVTSSHYFADEIFLASEKGLISGFPDQTFRPNEKISRAETLAILKRAYNIERGIHSITFNDVSISHWAIAPIQTLSSNHLVGGYTDSSFRPNRSVTRAEFSVFVTRMIQHEPIDFENVNQVISEMSLEQKIGQMIMPDLRTWHDKKTTTSNEGTAQLINDYYVGGMILFEKNSIDAPQMAQLTHELQLQASGIPLFIATDQEGGAVKRIPGGTNMPGNMALGATRSPQLSYQAGNVIGTELDSLGINMNFAPVLDVNVNPENPIIGIRSFSEDPELVSKLGVSFIDGLHDAGVIATAKHFPGHGDTITDSHLALPELPHDLERLAKIEFKPFQAAIDNGIDMIMTAHVTLPAIDNTKVISKKDGEPVTLPATLSKKVLTDLLREELQYDGVIVTDAFTMKAITDHFGEEEAAIKTVNAGADIILMPQDVDKTFYALVNAVKQGEISEKTIDESVERILKIKLKYDMFEKREMLDEKLKKVNETIGQDTHRKVEQTIAEKAVSVHKTDEAFMYVENLNEVTILAPQQKQLALLQEEAAKVTDNNVEIKGYTYKEFEELNPNKIIEETDYLILATYQHRSDSNQKNLVVLQSIVNLVNETRKGYAVLSLGDPYENRHIQNINYYLAIYGDSKPNINAGMKVIFQQLEPTGSFPVTIK